MSGYALTIQLPQNIYSGTGCYNTHVTELLSFAAFEVEAYSSSIKRIDAYGHYAHQKNALNVTPSVNFSGANISVSPVSVFSSPLTTHAKYTY